MHGSILLSAARKLLPGLRRLRALVLTSVNAANPCSQRYVVENRRKLIASLPINGFSFLTEVQNSPSDAVDKR